MRVSLDWVYTDRLLYLSAEYLSTAPGLSEGLRLPSLTDQLDSAPPPSAAPPQPAEPPPAELGYDWVWQRPEGEAPAADQLPPTTGDLPASEQQAAELEAALKVGEWWNGMMVAIPLTYSLS